MATTESHTEVRGGHGNWPSPNFNHDSITRSVGEWRNNDKTTRLPATRVARELLRKLRDATVGINRRIGFFSDIEMDTEDIVWHGSRVLGRGTSGIAIYYTAHDAKTAQEVDALVLKETDWNMRLDAQGRPGLACEAAVLADYNKQDPRNRILFLRRFAFNREDGLQRFYLEYCPHPDLFRMKSRYALFQQFLPELYIWHVLEQLLQDLVVLQQPPRVTTVTEEDCSGSYEEDDLDMTQAYCVHTDLKFANVLSCREVQRFRKRELTYILPGTSLDPDQWRHEGTPAYFSPEQRQWKGTDDAEEQPWNPPPNNTLRPCDHKHDVWCVGMMVFFLMTMSREDALRAFMDRPSLTQQAYHQNGNHFLPDFDWHSYFDVVDARAVYKSFPYSRELRGIVRTALTPEADRRPLPGELLETLRAARVAYVHLLRTGLRNRENAKNGMHIPKVSDAQAEFDQLQHPESWEDATRLYFQNNDINQMVLGNVEFPAIWAAHRRYHLDSWADPDWPSLRMPIFAPRKGDVELPGLSINAVDEVVQNLWHNKPFVDQPSKDTHPAIAMNDIRVQTTDPPPAARRVEADYTNMSLFDILKAIDDDPDAITDMDDAIQNADRNDPLRSLRVLDGNPQTPDPLPRRESYEAHYATTLLAEAKRRLGGDEGKNFKRNKAGTIDRLMELDQSGTTGDGAWRKAKPIPEKNKKRKR